MGLESFEIGVDETGVEELMRSLQTLFIDDLNKALDNTSEVFSKLDEAWVGVDKDTYKRNVEKTIASCKDAFNGITAQFTSNIKKVSEDMKQFRESLVQDTEY